MPVLDANALKTDPQGVEFLQGVLRQSNPARASFEKTFLGHRKPAWEAKPREARPHCLTAL
ncbi:hypothetical protein [Microvirga rosea]|uniref:hypothetical protein n=1 Tax=Microvirga rosea TaxID=2715425 RepID=UPI001D0A6144|nr:hypothetical protein [Microvirga rosea]MCB8819624.1 hypothetical protein [Microvirga rosea]